MKVLFSSANCMLDPSSGAAISVKTLLELLAERAVECASLTATIFDQPIHPDPLENLRRADAEEEGADDTVGLWHKPQGGVRHFVFPTTATARGAIGRKEEIRLLERAIAFLESFQPDVLLTYDSGYFERSLIKAARERGIATAFYLANPTYTEKALFEAVDLVLTDTQATRNLYLQRLGLDALVVGKFVRKPSISRPVGNRRYVTFVNPSPEKGVTLFYRILELAREKIPKTRFLVVESRATLAAMESRTGMKFSDFRNLRRIGLQEDMSSTYARTKILLLPSLWHESGSRSIVEACSLGIPTVASNRGGTPEMLGNSGIMLEPPAPLINDHWLIPPRSEAAPWVDAIRCLVRDSQLYRHHQQAALAQWKHHDPEPRLNLINEAFSQFSRNYQK